MNRLKGNRQLLPRRRPRARPVSLHVIVPSLLLSVLHVDEQLVPLSCAARLFGVWCVYVVGMGGVYAWGARHAGTRKGEVRRSTSFSTRVNPLHQKALHDTATIVLISVCLFLFVLTLLLSSFWTSRGHRCRPFFPPVLAFNSYRA